MQQRRIISIYEKMQAGEIGAQRAVDFVEGVRASKGEGDPLYNMDVLNTSVSAKDIVEMVKNAAEFEKDKNCPHKGIRLMFYGCSGSGKSQFANHIAKELDKKIVSHYASDILSKWVGESERNLAESFFLAEKNGNILLFDEVDSFLTDRESVFSWERTNTNEFLNQIERFKGILICTSNLKDVMDKAMLRRFHILVEFKPLTKDGISTLLKTYFGNLEFSERQIERLSSFNSATPGDFSILHSRLRFMKKDAATQDYIMDELCKMQDGKISGKRKIGF
ncbi:MAG: ATP-binding protein [Treponema sp.]|nr:ATP-binding protein [Treponema sp.]